jgi:3-oxoacyl-[acyl-carrier protein] reductase
MSSLELAGKVSLVTGASRGLGKAIALKLAGLGSKVAVNYLSRVVDAENVMSTIVSQGGEAMLAPADIRESETVKAMIRQIIEKWGKIDILVNNAGITMESMLLRMPDEAWDKVIDTNLRGAYTCTKFALRSMMAQQWGRIINISSLAGLIGNVGQTNYTASKGGLIAFTRSLAQEVGALKITANAIAPGFTVTEMTDKLPAEQKEAILARIALKRFGRPDDIAEVAAFLASDRAGYITGQVINVDGCIN